MPNNVKVIIEGVNQSTRAFQEVEEGLGSMRNLASAVAEGLGLIKIAELTEQFVGFVNEQSDAIAQMDRMARQSGQTAAQFMELKGAAELNDIPLETLGVALKKLQTNMAEAAAGNSKAVQLFKDLGVSVNDAEGRLRPAREVLFDIASRFKDAADGAGKSALAVQAFGRGGDVMISFLDQGREGLEEATSAASRFGNVLDGDALDAVLRYHEALMKLRAEGEGFKTQFVGELTKQLGPLADALGVLTGNTESFSAEFGKFLGADLGKSLKEEAHDILSYASAIADATIRVAQLAAEFVGADQQAAQLDAQLAQFDSGIKSLFKTLDSAPKGALAGFLSFDFNDVDASIAALEKRFPSHAKKPLAVTAPVDPEKMMKAQTELRKAQAAQDVAIAQGESKDELAALELLKEQGLVTLQSYYKERYDVTVGGIDAEIQALVEEVAAQQKVVDAMKKGTPEQVKAQAELVQMQTQLISKSEERGRVVQQLQSEELKGTREFGYQVAAIQAQIDESKDHSAEVAIAAIRKEYDEKRRILASAGQDTSELDNVEQMAIAAAKAEALAKQIEQVYADMEEKVAAVNAEMAQGHITDIDGSTKANEIRGQAAAQLADLVEKYKELATESGDPQLIANGEKFGKQIDTLKQKVTLLGQAARDAFQRGFESFLGDVENGRWLKALEDFGQAFVDAMNQILAKMLAVYAMQKLLGWLGSFGGGGGFAGGGVADAGGLAGAGVGGDVGVVPFFAAGGHMDAGDMGVVGDQGPELWVPDAGGHVVPLGGNAVSSGGTQVTVVNHVDARGAQMGFADYLEQRLQQTTETAVKRAVFESEDRRRRRP